MSPRASQASIVRRSLASVVTGLGLTRPEPPPGAPPLTPTVEHALTVLLDGPMPQGELATRLHLQKSTVSRLTDQLVDGGWARRSTDPDDARRAVVQLSAKGTRRAERQTRAQDDAVAELLGRLSVEDRRALVQGLAALAEAAG